MGVCVWTFLRSKPGELSPIAQRAVDEFIANAGRLAPNADGFVRYAEVIVNLENRRAVEVLRVGFFQYRALDDGRIDPEHFHEIMATAHESAFGGLQITKPPRGVVIAEHQFAKRRLDHLNAWKPTQVEISMLRDCVNRKARREIM